MTRRLPILTQASVVAFGALYFVAARMYPGGTRIDHLTIGFSFRDNYWCDLLDERAYCGARNAGAPVALAGMLVLCLGLGALWWAAPTRFVPGARRRRGLVRGAGLVSCALIPFLGTRHHDLTINLAGLFAIIAFVTTMLALARATRLLRALALLALLLAVGTWAVWQTRIGVGWLPVVQKGAFFFFLAWAFRLASELRASPT